MLGICKTVKRWWIWTTQDPLLLTKEVKPKKKKKKKYKRKPNPYGGKWKGNL